MSRQGNGNYLLPQPPFVPGTTIASSPMNSDLSDIAAALTQSISKDGQTVYTGNQPMGGNKLTNLGPGESAGDSVNLGQVADGSLTYGGEATGSANAIVIATSPGITAYSVGQMFSFMAAANNTGAVTVNVNGVGAGALTWPDGSALVADDIVAGGMYEIEVKAATPVFHMQTGANVAATQAVGNSTRKIATTAFVQAAVAKVYVQTFTASGTYTPHPGMVTCLIECVGPGGGGGGVATTFNSINSGGGGGGAGGYSRKLATAADIGASQTVTIGAAGAGGSAGNNAGGNGGDTSVGTLCIAKGGSGGGGCPLAGSATGGAGGVAGTGDVAAPGMPGMGMSSVSGNANWGVLTALGGSGPFGAAAASVLVGNGSKSNGPAALGYGAGGGGGVTSGDAIGSAAGGAGSGGFVRITEFCNQ